MNADNSNMAVLFPREAGRYITKQSQHVSIIKDGVNKVAKMIYGCVQTKDIGSDVDRWKLHLLYPKTEDQAAIDWVFVSDTLNFSFWSEDEDKKCMIRYGGQEWTGYLAMCAALNRAIDEGIPITDPKFYSSVSRDELAHILRSDTPYQMPMLDDRLHNLHDAGKTLLQKFDGSFVNVMKQSGQSAQTLLQLIIENFPSYRDEAEFEGKRVALYKRAQILVGDIWAACAGKGLGTFPDISTLTVFADYRIPQALVYFGAMKYSEELMDKLKQGALMENGSREEVEIRGVTIETIEQICEAVRHLLAADPALADETINPVMIDHYLWDFRRDHAQETAVIPLHKTRCIYY